jgi:peptidoglycan/xylan/chitin deacetylase (PgdA/CDA1 family)
MLRARRSAPCAAQGAALACWSERVRLTFDDGPGEDTEAVLDLLAVHGLRAMFFLVGERVTERPAVVRRIAAEGHVVGNHSFDHPDLTALGAGAIADQLKRTSDAIEEACGIRPRLFRPPFGHTSPEVEAAAERLGMQTMLWDVDSGDWSQPGPVAIAKAIRTAPPRAIVLLHDGPAGGLQTVEALRMALRSG